jgi:hypothetical protein
MSYSGQYYLHCTMSSHIFTISQQSELSTFLCIRRLLINRSPQHCLVDRLICDGNLQHDAGASDHQEQALPPHILEQRQNILASRERTVVRRHCMHCFNFLQSDPTFIKWVCLVCKSGPYPNIFECKYCKLKACQPCFNKNLIQKY